MPKIHLKFSFTFTITYRRSQEFVRMYNMNMKTRRYTWYLLLDCNTQGNSHWKCYVVSKWYRYAYSVIQSNFENMNSLIVPCCAIARYFMIILCVLASKSCSNTIPKSGKINLLQYWNRCKLCVTPLNLEFKCGISCIFMYT